MTSSIDANGHSPAPAESGEQAPLEARVRLVQKPVAAMTEAFAAQNHVHPDDMAALHEAATEAAVAALRTHDFSDASGPLDVAAPAVAAALPKVPRSSPPPSRHSPRRRIQVKEVHALVTAHVQLLADRYHVPEQEHEAMIRDGMRGAAAAAAAAERARRPPQAAFAQWASRYIQGAIETGLQARQRMATPASERPALPAQAAVTDTGAAVPQV